MRVLPLLSLFAAVVCLLAVPLAAATSSGPASAAPAATPAKPKAGGKKGSTPPRSPDEIRNQAASPIGILAEDRGRIAWRYLDDQGSGQDVALYVPDGVKEVRGVLISLHRRSEAHRSDLHAFARAHGLAVFGTLIRWTGYDIALPDQIGKLGAALGHPEIATAPWILQGFSRNVGANIRLTRLLPERVVCLLSGGGPGIGLRINDPDEHALFSRIPMMQVNGSSDPFTAIPIKGGDFDFSHWQRENYPLARKANLPYAFSLAWGAGHEWTDQALVLWPFAEAVMRARLSAPGQPLKPWPDAAAGGPGGMLLDPADYSGKGLGEPVAAAGFSGDATRMIWLPDARTAHCVRAYLARESSQRVHTEVAAGSTVLKLSAKPDAAVAWYDGERLLGRGDANGTLTVPRVLTGTPEHGVPIIYAMLDPDGTRQRTKPVALEDGLVLDLVDGAKLGARIADAPERIIALPPAELATLRALAARRDSTAPARWHSVLREDFSAGLKPQWYEYYHPPASLPGAHTAGKAKPAYDDNSIKVVDGVLRISGSLQVAAMLPFDLPDDLVVTYRARALSDAPCDLSLAFSANPFGSAFPWREGMLFQFGGKRNTHTTFLVKEQPRGGMTATAAAADPARPGASAAFIVPKQWHAVRVERRAGVCTASIDGVEVARAVLDEDERASLYGRRIGFYTFGGEAEFDDIDVQLWRFDDPASVTPAVPSDGALDALVVALAGLRTHQFAQQRSAADWALRTFSLELAASFGRVAPQITDKALSAELAAQAQAVPPP